MKSEPHKFQLVLASASPRRAELLRNAAINFSAIAAHIPERRRHGESALDYVQRLSREKASAIAAQYSDAFVVGADTEVIVAGDEVLGKPRDSQDASRMLRLLSGRTHRVSTGVTLIGPGTQDTRVETTEVTMAQLSEQEISDYVANGEPLDKAGAYAIQGIASRWVMRLDGCYFNVVGLPVPLVYRMLKDNNLL